MATSHRVYTEFTQGLRGVYAGSTQGLHRVYAGSAQGPHRVYAGSTQGLHRVCTGFTTSGSFWTYVMTHSGLPNGANNLSSGITG